LGLFLESRTPDEGLRPLSSSGAIAGGHAGLASGVYYYTLILRNQTIRKQCVLIR